MVPPAATTPDVERQRRIAGAAGVVSAFTLGSRLLGLVRDVLLAQCMGGATRDAFLFAWTLPNLFRRLFGEGALSAAFIPTYTARLTAEDEEGARHLARHTGGALLLALGLVVLLLEAVAWAPLPWARLFPEDDPEKVRLVLELTRVLAPYTLLICMVAFLAGIYQARRSFARPAAMPMVLNLVWIAALGGLALLAGGGEGLGVLATPAVRLVAWAIVGAGVLQLAIMYWPQRRHLGGATLRPRLQDPGVREVLRRFLPMTLGLGIYQLNIFLDRFIAEALVPGDGAVSALYLGDRLMQLPQALVGIAVATAAFPEFSRLSARGQLQELGRCVGDTLRLCLAVSLPAAVGLALLAGPVIQLFFHDPVAFDAVMVDRTTWVVVIVAGAIIATSANHALVRAFYAQGDTRTPVGVGILVVLVNLTLNLSLVGSLQEKGLALATLVSTALNALLLHVLLHRRLPSLPLADLLRQVPGVAVASAGMGLGVYLCLHEALPRRPGLLQEVLRVVVPVLVGVGLYGLLAPLCRVREVTGFLRRVRQRSATGG